MRTLPGKPRRRRPGETAPGDSGRDRRTRRASSAEDAAPEPAAGVGPWPAAGRNRVRFRSTHPLWFCGPRPRTCARARAIGASALCRARADARHARETHVSFDVSANYTIDFAGVVSMRLQQRGSKLRRSVMESKFQGKAAKAVDQVGPVTASRATNW